VSQLLNCLKSTSTLHEFAQPILEVPFCTLYPPWILRWGRIIENVWHPIFVKILARQAPIHPVCLCSLADSFSNGSGLLLHFYRVMKLYPLVGMVNTNRK
jgi:hypothetical protein